MLQVDPTELVWTEGRTQMDQEAYLGGHPPRCLAAFDVQKAELPGVTFDGHGEESNIIFLLSCKCGHDQHYVLGHYWRNPDHVKPATSDKFDALFPNFFERVADRVKRHMMSQLNLTEADYVRQQQDRPPVFLSPIATRCEVCER